MYGYERYNEASVKSTHIGNLHKSNIAYIVSLGGDHYNYYGIFTSRIYRDTVVPVNTKSIYIKLQLTKRI